MNKQILVLGNINVDHILRVERFPTPGQAITGTSYEIVAGGKGANQAVACARLGGNTHMIAAIGQDDSGQEIVQQLADEGIDTAGIIKVNNPDESIDTDTGVALIFVNGKGENTMGTFAGANDHLSTLHIEQHYHRVADADYLLLQQEIPRSVMKQAAAIAQEHGTTVVLNPAPGRELTETDVLPVDIITPNQTEAEILTGVTVSDTQSAARASALLHERGISRVVITMGHNGAWVSSTISGHPDGMQVPGFPVRAVDTAVASDTFNGALLVAMAEGKSLQEAAFFANASAALAVMRSGSQSTIPYRFEVEEFIQCDQEISAYKMLSG